uniref:Uncharacterized protein n=1 Tax=Glossina brevipalpis TaxID=37001 RepID=A0A1A9W733_9MUSC
MIRRHNEENLERITVSVELAKPIHDLLPLPISGITFVAAIIHFWVNREIVIREAFEFGSRLASFKMQHRGLDCFKNYTVLLHDINEIAADVYANHEYLDNMSSKYFFVNDRKAILGENE